MTIQEQFDEGLLDDSYMEFIMANANRGDRIICNGDTLLDAFEDGYLFEEFIKSLENQ